MTEYSAMLRFLRDLQTRLRFSEYEAKVLADIIERIDRLEGCQQSAETFPKIN